MSELTEYEIRQFNNSINNINKILDGIEKENQRNVFDYYGLMSKLNQYCNDAKNAQKYVEKAIKEVTNGGKGIFFRKQGINDLLSMNINSLNDKVNKLSDNYSNKFKELLEGIGTLKNVEVDFSSDFTENDNDIFVFPVIGDDLENTQKDNPIDLNSENENSNSTQVTEVVKSCDVFEEKDESKQSELISNIDDVSTKKDENNITKKKIIIRKNTPLDSDEIKQLFIDRHLRYGISLNQLNEGIKFAGNNVDKNKILLGSMYAKYRDDLGNKDYFHILNDTDLLIEFLEENDKEECLNLLFGKFYLMVSGWKMAHSHYLSKESFDRLTIDPRICTKKIIDLNTYLQYDELTLMSKFESSKYVLLLSNALSEPFYDVSTSSKLMIVSYKHPNDFIKCSDTGFKRIN